MKNQNIRFIVSIALIMLVAYTASKVIIKNNKLEAAEVQQWQPAVQVGEKLYRIDDYERGVSCYHHVAISTQPTCVRTMAHED